MQTPTLETAITAAIAQLYRDDNCGHRWIANRCAGWIVSESPPLESIRERYFVSPTDATCLGTANDYEVRKLHYNPETRRHDRLGTTYVTANFVKA